MLTAVLLRISYNASPIHHHGRKVDKSWLIEVQGDVFSCGGRVGLDGLLVALTLGTVLGLVGLVAQGILGGGGTVMILDSQFI